MNCSTYYLHSANIKGKVRLVKTWLGIKKMLSYADNYNKNTGGY